MSDYLKQEVLESLDVRKRKLRELRKEINMDISRIRPYVNSRGAYAIKQITNNLNEIESNLDELSESI